MKRWSVLLLSFSLSFLFAAWGLSCAPKSARTEVAVAAPAPADSWLKRPLPVDVQVRSGRLENGMRYYIRANRKPELRAELRLAVDVGSILEEDDQQGLAHFVEHMAFNGTEHFAKQELVDYLQSIGMRFGPDLNAYTGFDETVYMLTIPTDDPEIVHRGFQILKDWGGGISFEAEEIDKERGVVVEEWRVGRGADARVRDQQLPVLLHQSRYAQRLPIGQKAVLDTFRHERLRDFYRSWYRPDLMAFVAVGDFDAVRIEELMRRYLGAIPAAQTPQERPYYPVPDHEQPLFAIATDPELTSTRLAVYHKRDVTEQQSVGAYRGFILRSLYHGMLNQRLYELSIGDRPPFLRAGSGQDFLVRTKEYFALSALVADGGIERGLEALLTEARRAQVHGFAASELAREKKERLRFIEQAYRERDKTESHTYAAEYLRNFFEDEPIPGLEFEHGLYQTFVPQISLDEINEYARQVVRPSSRVVTVSMPDKEGVAPPSEASLQAVFERVATAELAPYEDKTSDQPLLGVLPEGRPVIDEAEVEAVGVTEWTLANGVRVVFKPTDFQNDQILFSAFSPGGHSLVADEAYVAASTADGIVRRSGVGAFDEVELQKLLAGKVVRVAPWIGALEEGFSGGGSPEDIETLLQLVYLYATAARRDTTAFNAYREQIRGVIANRDRSPESAFGDTLRLIMAQHHPRARPWSEALIAEMDLDRSLQIFRQRFAEMGDFTFLFVGNFAVEDMRPLIERYLGALPTAGVKETWRDVGIAPPDGVVERAVYKGTEPKSRTQLVFNGPFVWNRQNVYDIYSMADVLRIKLREVLREDKGGTYGVGVGASVSRFPRAEYSLSVSFGCDPERVEELTQEVFVQIDSLVEQGTTAAYTTKVQQMQRRQREVQLQENGFWLEALRTAYYHGTDPGRILRYEELVQGLTPGVVQQAAKKYFNRDRYVRVVLYPESYKDK